MSDDNIVTLTFERTPEPATPKPEPATTGGVIKEFGETPELRREMARVLEERIREMRAEWNLHSPEKIAEAERILKQLAPADHVQHELALVAASSRYMEELEKLRRMQENFDGRSDNG